MGEIELAGVNNRFGFECYGEKRVASVKAEKKIVKASLSGLAVEVAKQNAERFQVIVADGEHGNVGLAEALTGAR
jgi:hypothetical protein